MRKLDRRNEPHRTVVSCKVYLVWKGTVKISVDGRVYTLQRGEAMMVPPGHLQQVRQIRKGSMLLLFRSPDVGDTQWDKLDSHGQKFKKAQKGVNHGSR